MSSQKEGATSIPVSARPGVAIPRAALASLDALLEALSVEENGAAASILSMKEENISLKQEVIALKTKLWEYDEIEQRSQSPQHSPAYITTMDSQVAADSGAGLAQRSVRAGGVNTDNDGRENASLKVELEHSKELIAAQSKTIASQEETIGLLRQLLSAAKAAPVAATATDAGRTSTLSH
jgi:regulator of replication initiation timing